MRNRQRAAVGYWRAVFCETSHFGWSNYATAYKETAGPTRTQLAKTNQIAAILAGALASEPPWQRAARETACDQHRGNE
jgi:hypothetical protein